MVCRLGRPAWIAIGMAVALVGCGSQKPTPPGACATSEAALERALLGAPSVVRLAAATPISLCVERASTDVELQTVGSLLTATADRLAARALADPAAAVALGYLVGAARRGAARSNGVASELSRRIDVAAALRGATPQSLAALHRGILAGQSGG